MSNIPHRVVGHGRTPNMPLNNRPASGWLNPADWATWSLTLPNAYTYRLRAVDAQGNPLQIPRPNGRVDRYGLLYVGETGIKNNDPSFRGEKLAHGVADQAVGTVAGAHGGARKFWAENWHQQLAAIDANYRLEFGWDPHDTTVMIANKDARLPENQQKDEMIENSGKVLAMGLEDVILTDYEREHGVLPPLNSVRSPGIRDKDRKTKHTVDQDRHHRNEGDVDVEIKDRH